MALSISRSYTLVGLTYKDDLTSDPGEVVITTTTDNLVLNIPLFLKTSADEILQAHYDDIKGEIENLIVNKNHTFS